MVLRVALLAALLCAGQAFGFATIGSTPSFGGSAASPSRGGWLAAPRGSTTTATRTRTASARPLCMAIRALEHVNLNVPSQGPAFAFYFGALGCALDPRRAGNVEKGEVRARVVVAW